jgi:hypothetical protein
MFVDIEPKYNLTKDFTYRNQYCDYSANLLMEPMKPIVLADFFDKASKAGPWAWPCFHGRAKDLAELAKLNHTEWKNNLTTASNQFQPDASARQVLDDTRKEANKLMAESARKAAKTALAKRRARHAEPCG